MAIKGKTVELQKSGLSSTVCFLDFLVVKCKMIVTDGQLIGLFKCHMPKTLTSYPVCTLHTEFVDQLLSCLGSNLVPCTLE